MSKGPCHRDCPDRTLKCHDTCEDYIKWAEERRAERLALSKEREADAAVHKSNAHRVKQMKKGRGK